MYLNTSQASTISRGLRIIQYIPKSPLKQETMLSLIGFDKFSVNFFEI